MEIKYSNFEQRKNLQMLLFYYLVCYSIFWGFFWLCILIFFLGYWFLIYKISATWKTLQFNNLFLVLYFSHGMFFKVGFILIFWHFFRKNIFSYILCVLKKNCLQFLLFLWKRVEIKITINIITNRMVNVQ